MQTPIQLYDFNYVYKRIILVYVLSLSFHFKLFKLNYFFLASRTL